MRTKVTTKPICSYCESTRIAKHGTVVTVGKGTRQRLKCQSCGHTFYEPNGKKPMERE